MSTLKENRICKKHGLTIFFLAKAKNTKANTRWRCEACQRSMAKERRRKIKEDLVNLRGGKCETCGYNKCIAALHFHHRDPSLKSFHVSSRSLESSIEEIKKCDLLCANCHAEKEYEE